ncbi:MAG: hypothetical protein EBS49_07885, partial [Verrucomicrobia bacterium]|nr:hypothetical protein [Verrucomicrobiota bacterium]
SLGWDMGSVHTVSSADAHSGTSSLRSLIPGGATGAQLVKTVPTILPGSAYTFSFWAKQISAGPSYVQYYKIEWLAANGAVTSAGWVNFSGGTAAWSKISASPIPAPTNAVSARLVFYFATGAVSGAMGEVWLDDVAFEYQTSGGPAVPAQTRQLSSTNRPVLRLTWPTLAGVSYQPEATTSLRTPAWSALSAPLTGTGAEISVNVPAEGTGKFYRVARPILQPAAPANLRIVPTGLQDSLTVAWDSSASPGVTGYRILYGTSPGNLDQSIDLGNVQTVTLPGLTQGQTYHLTVIAYSVDGNGPVGTTTLTAQPETQPVFQPLFTAATSLQPDPVTDTAEAKVTHWADRARDRHAREGIVRGDAYRYDHYLTWYWEQRMLELEIIDRVAKGGNSITFNPRHLPSQCPGHLGLHQRLRPLSGGNGVPLHHDHLLQGSRKPAAPDRGQDGAGDQPVHPCPEKRPEQLLRHRLPLHRRTGNRPLVRQGMGGSLPAGGRRNVLRFLHPSRGSLAWRPDHPALPVLQRAGKSLQTDGGKHHSRERAALHAR